MITKWHGRAAAWAAAAILTAIAGYQLYRGLGGTWGPGLPELANGSRRALSASEQMVYVISGLVTLACAGVLLVRVGYWQEHLPFAVARVAHVTVWVIAALALAGALQNFAGQTNADWFVEGSLDLIVALLAFVVARSERPVSPKSGAAPTRSGKLGRPTAAH